MAWRIAKSLNVLLDQLNALYPKRSKISDGSIGDAAHASRSSDHNPWVKDGSMGVVTARDFTHDPTNGLDAHKLADTLKANADPRIKYVISNGRIWNPSVSPDWRKYSGVNSHAKHTHVSVKSDKAFYDDMRPWKLTVEPAKAKEPVTPPPTPQNKKATVAPTSRVVEAMQILGSLGWEKYKAAAIIGNGIWESGGNKAMDLITTALGDGGTAHGAWQWRGDRYIGPKGLLSFARTQFPGRSSAEIIVQVNFVDWELKSVEKRAYEALNKAKDVDEAVVAVMSYLRPGGFTWDNPRAGHGFKQRLELAKQLL